MAWGMKLNTETRIGKNPEVDYEATHKHDERRECQIMVKVVDVFGDDMNKVMKVRVK